MVVRMRAFPMTGHRLLPVWQAGLRELQERARAVRQAFAARRQAVLLLARHLAEGAVVAVGQEHRVVAEALLAARRPDQRAVDAASNSSTWPSGQATQSAETKCALRCSGVTAPRSRSMSSIVSMAWRKSLSRTGPARRIDAGRAVERIDREPGIVGEGRQARMPAAAALALMRALSRKRGAGLFRLGEAELARRHRRRCRRARAARASRRACPGCASR